MAIPQWFRERRYGMFVHANIATVPAFAPVNEYADWYWAFLESKPDVVLHPTCPLPEVIAFHEEHYGNHSFDEFLPALTFERFDADWYAQLLEDAGMRYLVHVTKHHDGFCWWNTKLTDRNAVRVGPRRDVVRELADAVRGRGHIFGCYYSLLDWAHPHYPDPERYVDGFLLPQLRELLEGYQPAVLWGDGHWGHSGTHWRAAEIAADARAFAARHGFELAINDRFFAPDPDFTTFEYDVPARPPDGVWELCRGLSHSFCVNRAERPDDYLSARAIVALLVETVAKGGNLLLNVGPNADGTVSDLQTEPLRESGAWVRRHADAIHRSTSWDVPGDGAHWYTRTGDIVHAFDLSAAAEPRFMALRGATRITTPDGRDLPFRTEGGRVIVDARGVPRDPLGVRYLAFGVLRAPAGAPVATGGGATVGERLAAAQPGDIVELGAGRYAGESFPLTVPAGVTLRGVSAASVIIDAGGHVAIVLGGDDATVEHVSVTGAAPGYMMLPPTCVTAAGVDRLTVRDCVVESILISGGSGHSVTGNVVAGGKVWLMGAARCEVRANYQHGLRWGAGIEVLGGDGHVIAENECRDDLAAIKCIETTTARVERNLYETRWLGVHLLNSRDTVLYCNQAWRTMRAVDVEGGHDNRIEKQLAEHCDSGVMVEGRADRTTIYDSWFHDCRVGLYLWDADEVVVERNAVSAPRDHAAVLDQAVDLDGNELGGDVWITPA